MDPTSGLLHWLPHGVDETWEDFDNHVEYGIHGILGELCVESETCLASFEAEVQRALDVADEIGMLAYFDPIQDQIARHVAADPRFTNSVEEIEADQVIVRAAIRDRRTELDYTEP